jgi:hypothetical protein
MRSTPSPSIRECRFRRIRSRCSWLNDVERATSNKSSTRVSSLLTFCPPGPLLRDVRNRSSEVGSSIDAVMRRDVDVCCMPGPLRGDSFVDEVNVKKGSEEVKGGSVNRKNVRSRESLEKFGASQNSALTPKEGRIPIEPISSTARPRRSLYTGMLIGFRL